MDNMYNKYDIVLDIIENHEKYTSNQLDEILSDPETRQIYNLLCKTDSAIESDKTVDVDAEWEKFSRHRTGSRRSAFMWRGRRAASVAIIISISIAAIAAGIAIGVAVKDRNQEISNGEKTEVTSLSGTKSDELITESQDSIKTVTSPVMFEDASLEEIMKTISAAYGVDVTFRKNETATLHLFYRLDPTLPLDEIISQLNTFEQINISRTGNNLIIN